MQVLARRDLRTPFNLESDRMPKIIAPIGSPLPPCQHRNRPSTGKGFHWGASGVR